MKTPTNPLHDDLARLYGAWPGPHSFDYVRWPKSDHPGIRDERTCCFDYSDMKQTLGGTPSQLREIWTTWHEAGLVERVDAAVGRFTEAGLEVAREIHQKRVAARLRPFESTRDTRPAGI